MSGSFTLNGKLAFHDKVTPHVGATVRVTAVPWPDGSDNVVYSQGATALTDADGTFSIPLLTETDLYYTVISDDTPALFTPVTFLAPANGVVLDLSDVVSVNPGAITPTYVTQAQTYAAQAASSAAAAAASAAGIVREATNGVAGLDGSGKLFDIRLPDRLRNVAAREYATINEAGTVPITHPAYGADRMGVTAADTAIAAASTAAAAFGLAVLFPPGTYKVTGGVANATVGQKWLLPAGATIDGTASSTHVVSLNASGTGVVGGGKVNGGTIVFSCIFIANNLADVKVLGPELNGATYGVRVKGSTGPVTTRVAVRECTIHGQLSHGVFFNWECTDSEIASNQIYSTTGNGIWCGNGSTGLKITGNTIKNTSRMGIELAAGTGCADSLVAQNNIDTVSTIGISCDNSDRARVIGNRVTSPGSYGLEAAGTNYAVFEANIVLNSGSWGVAISAPSGSCDHNLIKGNQLINCVNGAIQAGGSANGAKYTQVIGNHIVDPGQNAGSVNAIIAVTGIGCDGWLVEGNTVVVTSGTMASTNLINVAAPNSSIIGNYIYVLAGVTTSGGAAINISTAAVNQFVRGNFINGNGKLGRGVLFASTVTGCVVDANTINGTVTDVINNQNAASNTNQISNNVYTLSAGNSIIFGAAMGNGNRSTTQGFIINTGPNRFDGNIGFYGTTPIAKPAVTGSRGGNAALASALTQLAALGLITDSTTA